MEEIQVKHQLKKINKNKNNFERIYSLILSSN